jgi:hypothetical protein
MWVPAIAALAAAALVLAPTAENDAIVAATMQPPAAGITSFSTWATVGNTRQDAAFDTQAPSMHSRSTGARPGRRPGFWSQRPRTTPLCRWTPARVAKSGRAVSVHQSKAARCAATSAAWCYRDAGNRRAPRRSLLDATVDRDCGSEGKIINILSKPHA